MTDTIFYLKFDACKKLSVVDCMKEYECRVSEHRMHGENQLLISYVKPFRPISSASIARCAMQLAGIDLRKFQAHAVRGAMASKSFLTGGKLDDILRAADWSNANTFAKHYYKPIEHMSDVVLQSYKHA